MPVREKPSKPVTRVRNKLFSKKSLTRKELHSTSFRSLPASFSSKQKLEQNRSFTPLRSARFQQAFPQSKSLSNCLEGRSFRASIESSASPHFVPLASNKVFKSNQKRNVLFRIRKSRPAHFWIYSAYTRMDKTTYLRICARLLCYQVRILIRVENGYSESFWLC